MDALRAGDPAVVGGRYRLLGRLGSGGTGAVFLGRSPGGRLVAVRCVHRDLAAEPGFRLRLARDLAAARAVGGHHTARLVDADPEAEHPWLVTAFIPGPALADAVRWYGPLPEAALRVLGAGLAEALVAIHGAGLVHGGLRPTKVLLAGDGPRVVDFGLASNAGRGTAAFFSPEQLAGAEPGPACDVFALGLVVCHAAGCAPFGTGGPLPHLGSEPKFYGLPMALRPLVRGCLTREPAERPTPAQLVELFEPAPQGPGGSWLPAELHALAEPVVPEAADELGPAGPTRLPGPRLRRAWAAGLTALVLLTAAIGVPTYVLATGHIVEPETNWPALPSCTAADRPAADGDPGPDSPTGHPATVPAGTPHAPALSSPPDRASAELGTPTVLSWGGGGSYSRVMTRLDGGDWSYSDWLTGTSCAFRPTGTGLYQWAVTSADATTLTLTSGWSADRYLVVRPTGSTAADPEAGAPDAPRPVAPADQTEVPVGEPVALSWTADGSRSSVAVLSPDGRWTNSPWTPGTSYSFTPATAGVYVWTVATEADGGSSSGVSEQRLLIAR
ncbi:hypothetical protein ACFYNO_31390 [Kitasatospora sp. NPDC006697]|uniref:protein kinase domain-containing protein n=1 Tax=Kitasatospora sp. NPDC006697 TaxID=3364020 RepID=UPI0036CC07FA